VSIAAEIISLRWGGEGARLSDTDGDIHAANPIASPVPVS
jgi:xanthine/CO dehydrogenase XdhC/CoxF family maturation factor